MLNRLRRSSGLALLTCLAGLFLVACDDEPSSSTDMASVLTCSQLCTQFLTCTQSTNPAFKGSTNALVPCENGCFMATEQVRTDLRTCAAKSCGDYVACATTAGLKLQMVAPPDLGGKD